MAFISFKQSSGCWIVLVWLISGLLILLLSLIIIKCAIAYLETFSEKLTSIKTADSEAVTFLLAYCLPLVGEALPLSDTSTSLYILVVLSSILYNSNCIYFNPLIRIFGYHLYEVVKENNVSCILLTRRTLRRVPSEYIKVVRLAEYVMVEKG